MDWLTGNTRLKKAQRLYEEGRQLRETNIAETRRKWEAAVEILKKSPKHDDNSQRLMNVIMSECANLYRYTNEPKLAMEMFTEALNWNVPLSEDDLIFLASEYATHKRDGEFARRVYAKILVAYSGKPKPDSLRGVYTFLEQRCCPHSEDDTNQKAQRFNLCSQLIDYDSKLPFPYYYRGAYYFEMADWSNALNDLQAAKKRKHNSSDIEFYLHFAKGKIEQTNANLIAAANHFRSAFKLLNEFETANPDALPQNDFVIEYPLCTYLANFELGKTLVGLVEESERGHEARTGTETNRINRAIEALNRAVGILDDQQEVWKMLGRAYYLSSKHNESRSEKAARLNLASEAYQKALALVPDAETYYDYARALRRIGAYDEAITQARNAISISPEMWRAYAFIGGIEARHQSYELAYVEYEKILALSKPPTEAVTVALVGMAQAKADQELYNEAEPLLKRAIDEGGASERILQLLAVCYEKMGLWTAQEDTLHQWQEIAPTDPAPCVALAKSLLQQNRLQEALQALEEATSRGIAPKTTAFLRGSALLRLEAYDAAQQAFAEAVDSDDSMQARYALGYLAAQQGDTERALQYLKEIPECAEAQCAMGILYDTLGNHTESNVCFRKALSLESINPLYLRKFAAALLKRGDAETALVYLKEAEELGDKTPAFRYLIGLALIQGKHYQAALEHWEALPPESGSLNNLKTLAYMNYRQAVLEQNTERIFAAYQRATLLGLSFEEMPIEATRISLLRARQSHSNDPIATISTEWIQNLRMLSASDPNNPNYTVLMAALDLLEGNYTECKWRLENIHTTLTPAITSSKVYYLTLGYLATGCFKQAEQTLQTLATSPLSPLEQHRTALLKAFLSAHQRNWSDALAELAQAGVGGLR